MHFSAWPGDSIASEFFFFFFLLLGWLGGKVRRAEHCNTVSVRDIGGYNAESLKAAFIHNGGDGKGCGIG